MNVSRFLPIGIASVETSEKNFASCGFQQISIGDISGIILSDGFKLLTPISAELAPNATVEELKDFCTKASICNDTIGFGANVLLLKINDRTILCDAGAGYTCGPDQGKLVQNMVLAGVKPEQVTDIIVSHCHVDHVGGLLNSSGQAMFPNATLYMSQQEYDFILDIICGNIAHHTAQMKIHPCPVMLAALGHVLQSVLIAYSDKIIFASQGDVLFDSIIVECSSGHTPGHFVLTIRSGNASLVHIGDAIHSEAIQVARPEWGATYDTDFELAAETRQTLLKQLSKTKQPVLGYHFSYPGIGYIRKNDGHNYIWEQVRCASPHLAFSLS